MSGFRPRMRWLHNWSGLLSGWLFFLIFVTGSCGYLRHDITLWMTPELRPLAALSVPPGEAADRAVDWLRAHAAGADSWRIGLPDEKSPVLRVAWEGKASGQQLLDPETGRPLAIAPRQTGGGDFLYRLHSDLHFVPALVGRGLVALLGVLLLVVLFTGLVAHRHLLRNLFRLRRGRGWRTRLDLHNASGVLALPFHLFVLLSGLVTVMLLLQPWGLLSVYGSGGLAAFSAQAFPEPAFEAPVHAAVPSKPALSPLIGQATARWGVAQPGEIEVRAPGRAGSSVFVAHPVRGLLAMRKPVVVFDPADGRVLATANEELSPAALFHSQFFGLHVAHFAGPALRLLFFALGLVGAFMVASGLLLWTDKRWRGTRRVRIVDRLNAAVIAGLPLAIAAYFWAGRLLPVSMEARAAAEADVLFAAWGLAFAIALLAPSGLFWGSLFALGGAALLGAGLFDMLGAYPVWKVDLVLAVAGCALLWLGARAARPARHRPRAGAGGAGGELCEGQRALGRHPKGRRI